MVGNPYGLSLPSRAFTDPDGDFLSFSASDVPAGLFFDAETETILGSPTEDAVGVHTVVVTATDPFGAVATSEFTLNVLGSSADAEGNIPPVLAAPIFNQTALVDQAFSFVVPTQTFSDADGEPLSFDVGGLPPNLFFSSADNSINGTPTVEDAGLHTLIVTAFDASGATASDEFVLDVIDILGELGTDNVAPVLTLPIFDQQAIENTPFVFEIPAGTFEDTDGDQLSFTVSGLPVDLSFDPASRSIVGTPTAAAVGLHSVTVIASDGHGGLVTDEFYLDIISADAESSNRAPVLVMPVFDQLVSEGDLFSLQLSDSFKDPDSDHLTFAITGLPTSLFFDAAANSIVGTPTMLDVGSYTVSVTVSDGHGGAAFDEFFLNVVEMGATDGNSRPFLSIPVFDQVVKEDDEFFLSLSGTFDDPDSDVLTIGVRGLPTSLFFDPHTNSIIGSPTTLDVGSYVVTVTAFDGRGGSAFDEFFLDVVSRDASFGNDSPFLSVPVFDQTAQQGVEFSLPLSGTFDDPNGDQLTFGISGLPTSLFFDPISQSIVGTPTDVDVGSYTVTVTAFDGRGGAAADDFFLDVLPPGAGIGNSFPQLQSPLFDEVVFEDETVLLSLDGVFVDPDGDLLTHAVSGLPTSLFLDSATNTIVGTPTDFDLGSYVIEVTAFDGRGGVAFDDFLLDVLSPSAGIGNSPPELRFPLYDAVAFENDTVSVPLTGIFADPDGDHLSYAVSGLPNSLFLDEASNTIVGTPTGLDLGSYVIEVTASDGRGGTASDDFFLNVLSPTAGVGNSFPFLQTPLLDEVAREDESFSLPLDGVFSDPDGDPLTYAISGLPTSLFLDPAVNAIVGTPTEFDLGSYAIEVTASDGRGGTASDDFFLDVRSATASVGNNPPVLQSPVSDAVVFENEPVFESLEGIFVDPDGDPLIYEVSGLPTSLFLDQDTNTVIGTPTAFDLGSYVVEVTAFDGRGGVASEEFFLNVLSPEEAVGNSDPFLQFPLRNKVVIENEPIFISLDGTFLDPDGDLLSYGVSGLPAGLFFNQETNSINGTPAATDVGLHSVTVTTSDGRGGSAFDDFFLDVVSAGGGPNTAPILLVPIADDSATEGIPHFQSIAGTFSDPDLDELSIAVSGLPSSLFFEPSTDSIQGTPTAEDVGDHFVTATASDGRGGTVSADFILSVASGNTPPTLVLPITPDPQNSSVNTPFNLSLSTFFSDPNPGDILTYTVSGAAWLTVDGSGNVSGTPTTADLSGSPYVVTVTATDLGTLSISDTFSLHVVTGNLPPSAIDDNYSTPEDVPLMVTTATGVLLNDSDADGGTLLVTEAPVSDPAHGSLTLNSDGSFTYTPFASYVGPDSFVYDVTDGQGGQHRLP